MNALLLQFLKEMQNKGRLKYYENHPLSLVSTFGIGGEAGVFVLPYDTEALIATSKAARGTTFKIIGNASNLLFDDGGFRGAVISTKELRSLSVLNEPMSAIQSAIFEASGAKRIILAHCGCALPLLSATAQKHGITGFEGLCSIPATVGGAIISNAGAFGNEISDSLIACEIFYPKTGKCILRSVSKNDFCYRKSNVCQRDGIILSAYFLARDGDPDEIKALMLKNRALRAQTQPQGVKSAGSYFKRPQKNEGRTPFKGKSAGELIDICGLKGFSVGGAAVSEKHANFLINKSGSAKAKDILTLAKLVKDTVYKKTGICLKEEVEFVPK